MNAFRKFRDTTSLTQEKVSELLGVERSTVAKWETGDAKPRAELLTKIADLYGVTVDDLLREPGGGPDDPDESAKGDPGNAEGVGV